MENIAKDIAAADIGSLAAPVYSVESLLQLAGIYGQQKVFSKIEGAVRAKGFATKVKCYNKYSYLTLTDREYSISVKFGAEQVVNENQAIVVEGLLFLKPSPHFNGLECYLDGNIIGSWQCRHSPAGAALPQLNKSRYVQLEDFILENGLEHIIIVGSNTAITDVLSHIDAEIVSLLKTSIIPVGKKQSVIRELGLCMTDQMHAFALVRGGDDHTWVSGMTLRW